MNVKEEEVSFVEMKERDDGIEKKVENGRRVGYRSFFPGERLSTAVLS